MPTHSELADREISTRLQNALHAEYDDVRSRFERYCAPLEIEDYGLQAVPETSPAKWHLAHTTWFFETFLLKPFLPNYTPFHPRFEYLFNSYYNGVGDPFPRPQRGLLSRPTVKEVYAYRHAVDTAMHELLSRDLPDRATVAARTELGLQHEMQHQELFFTDLKYNLARNPLFPTYTEAPAVEDASPAAELAWHSFSGGIRQIGTTPQDGFCFDNETPRHRVFLEPFQLASRPVTNADVLAFMRDGGYHQSSLWLADGWAHIQTTGTTQPLYWVRQDDAWFEFTLHGLQPLDPDGIACHLSGYEADAIARWFGARLPTEFEWEYAAQEEADAARDTAHFVERGRYHPGRADIHTLFGSIWQWTSSAYGPYPGYQPAPRAIGEYNGKFMCNQLVLRGGSCVTDRRQVRSSYRNFFYPPDRWQFSGLRLARNGG
ncbi:ergothioneine biosynthesis protein EgtB [Marinobacter sp. R17]|uniref:ergothioneine biosynthesis protein EgtB n=1 Tax=Marinobacter sp. R17 TaxID=2484250 RepID=UPI000F4B4FF1|nr:ergothioneine biosynthesis protein EgtB [Marinobacter sp. R17]ROU02239.1 ergothioneine biosynthesis protein EgtB [Marinobacter sp. R17]